jgi:ankyrin repeat protein
MSEYTSREEIHMAAMEGVKSSQLKKLAIQYGVDYRDHGGRTPLMYAVLGNQPRMCDTLLSLGAKVNTQDSTGLTPLLWATFQAKPQCMKILLR